MLKRLFRAGGAAGVPVGGAVSGGTGVSTGAAAVGATRSPVGAAGAGSTAGACAPGVGSTGAAGACPPKMEKRLFLVGGGVAAVGTGVSTATAALGATGSPVDAAGAAGAIAGASATGGATGATGACSSPRCWDGRGGEPPQEIGVVHPSDDAGLGADFGVAAGETDSASPADADRDAPGCRTSPWAANASPVLPPRRRRRRRAPPRRTSAPPRRRTTRPRRNSRPPPLPSPPSGRLVPAP